jgi:CubicO group peptidase (beta-lactamase class C family)
MSVLGALVERASSRPFGEYARAEIFEPLGMHDCWVGMPPERFRAYGGRVAIMHNTAKDVAEPVRFVDTEDATARAVPGGNGRGPMRDLVCFYEMLLGDGQRDGVRILSPQAVAAISARHRVRMLDTTFGIELDWGLGFAIDTYITGRHSSTRAFGHGGHQSSAAFCDPEHGVAVAVATNGMPGADRHHERMDEIATAVYVDLGIAAPGDPGRGKPYPLSSL